MPEALTSPPAAGDFAQRVVDWQRRHGRRGLPWQGTRDPYRVWLSEVMLQQTQVSTVLGYYARFLQRFPDVTALAQAPVDEVLALWSGLGYYSRARHLHRCAQAVAQVHGGVFPRDSATLQTLPGIGPSTAAAIAAFCHGERAAILDGNVKRVLARALGYAADLATPAHERALWRQAQALLPGSADMPAYTQGLMDLGAQVCTVRRPACGACPLRADCVAHAQDRPQDFPVKTRRVKRSRRASTLLWLCAGAHLWLSKRPERGVWAGLWSLPEWPAERAAGVDLPDWPGQWQVLPPVEHALTHFDWTLQPLRWTLPQDMPGAERASIEDTLGPGRWVIRDEALAMGLPAPVRRLLLEASGT